jgi:photosystem II stability/assembly factor-like uncharacterized protein
MKSLKYFIVILIVTFYSTSFGQWTPASGPWGGTINTIFVDGTDLWVGTDVAGIFFSSDGGANWVARNTGLSQIFNNNLDNGYRITCFARFDSLLFAGTDGAGLYRSTNNGTSWVRYDNGISTPYISSIIRRGGKLIVGTGSYQQAGNGIYVSSNGGTVWEHIGQVIPTTSYVVGFCTIPQTIQGPATVYTIVRDSIYKSTDDGATWSKPLGSLPNPGSGYLCLGAFGTTLYAGRYPGGLGIGGVVQVSYDSSQTWQAISTNEPGFGKAPYGFAVLDSVLYIVASADHLSNGYEYGGVFSYNSNQGGNAVESNTGFSWVDGRAIAVLGNTIFAGFNNDGLYRSTDHGLTWEKRENGIYNTTVASIVSMGRFMFASAGMTGYGAGSRGNGVYRSSDGGSTWTTVTVGMPNQGMLVYNLYASQGTLMLATNNGLYQSPDSGDTWYQAYGVTKYQVTSWSQFSSVTSGFVVGLNNGWALSQDFGANWTVSNTPGNSLGILGMGSVLLVSPTGNYLYRSTDNGVTWSQITTAPPPMHLVASGGTVFGYEGGGAVHHSNDLGLTWSNDGVITGFPLYNSGLSGLVAIINGTDTTIFSSVWREFEQNSFGVYETTNMGQTWTQINTGLVGAALNITTLFTDGEYIYAGTMGRGIWKRPLSQLITSVVDNSASYPASFRLSQNYPNPFNPTTKINYSIPHSEFVSLKVFNVLGEEVADLVNEYKPAGKYTIEFNGSNFSSGVYLFRLKAGSYFLTRKMTLLK